MPIAKVGHINLEYHVAERIPNSTLRVLPGAEHTLFWEFPEEAAGAIAEFLSAVPAPA
jgi:pimeloyl-ACP methyl ester carboxylesterase